MDFRQVVALVATVSQADGKEIVIGDGRYIADKGEKPERAELAYIIAEPYRARGIASLLLRHLACIGQDAGLSAFKADVLAYNAPMLAVFQHSGLPISGASGTSSMSRSLSRRLFPNLNFCFGGQLRPGFNRWGLVFDCRLRNANK